jgi:hypothetical protein
MQCAKLSEDELWRAIAHNTDTMSALLLEERDDSEINPCTRADLVLFVNSRYSDYTAELRRRHHCLNPVNRSILIPRADSLTPPAQTVTDVGETMPSDADFFDARIAQLIAAAPKHRETVTENRGAMKILLACLARRATVPAIIQYGVVAALIGVLIVGALEYGYGPYDYSYTAAPLYDYAGPAAPAPVHAAPPGYGPLVYTPQGYAPTSMTSLMIVSALLMGGASLAVAQNGPAAGGQLPVPDGAAASKPRAPGSTASIPARIAQHSRHDRMYMMAVKAPIKVHN